MATSDPFGTAYSAWTLANAEAAVSAAVKARLDDDAYKANQAFVEKHDHWQDGATWVGPDGGGDPVVRTKVLQAVKRQFTPNDVIAEVLGRVANALLKSEPAVSFVPLEPAEEGSEGATTQQAEAEAMRRAVAAWWDRVKLWARARAAVKRARWSTRGLLRVWIPPGRLERRTERPAQGAAGQARDVLALPTGLSIDAALERVELSDPEPGDAAVVTNPKTAERAAIFLSKDDDGRKRAELWYVDPAGGETRCRILSEGASSAETGAAGVNLGRRLPIAEMEAELLITEPVRRQQNRLNFFESLLNRVGETAGFPERYTLNAAPSGLWLDTAPASGPALDTKTEGGKTWYLHRVPRTLGASITTELVGLTYDVDDTGKKAMAAPGVTFKEPTDPAFAIKSCEHARSTILKSCRQAHVLRSTEADSSGYSIQQARAEFEDDATNTKGPLEGMLREIIECAVALAEAMGPSGAPRFLDRYRCVIDLHVSSGPLSTEERRANAEQVTQRLLSRESAMGMNGVEDVDAELARIAQELEASAVENADATLATLQRSGLSSPTLEAALVLVAAAGRGQLVDAEGKDISQQVAAELAASAAAAKARREQAAALAEEFAA